MMIGHAQPQFRLDTNLKTMLDTVVQVGDNYVAERCGRVSRESKQGQGGEESVTAVDIETSRRILERIRILHPASFSEEHILSLSERRHLNQSASVGTGFWQIDPIDGTDEFIQGRPTGYAIQASFLVRTPTNLWVPTYGLIYFPGRKVLWFTDLDRKTFFVQSGNVCTIPDPCRLDKLRGTRRLVDQALAVVPETDALTAALANQLGLEHEAIPSGGMGAMASQLFEGKAHLVIDLIGRSKEWDITPVIPILEACGGFACDLSGADLTEFNSDSLLNWRGVIFGRGIEKARVMQALNAIPTYHSALGKLSPPDQ